MSQFYLVAPSGYCINQQAAALGVARLQEAGHQVLNQQAISRRQQRFAGSDSERPADINQLAALEGKPHRAGGTRRLWRHPVTTANRLAGLVRAPAAGSAAYLRPQ